MLTKEDIQNIIGIIKNYRHSYSERDIIDKYVVELETMLMVKEKEKEAEVKS